MRKKRLLFYSASLCVCATMFGLLMLITIFSTYTEAASGNDALATHVVMLPAAVLPVRESEAMTEYEIAEHIPAERVFDLSFAEELVFPEVDFAALAEINPDTIGWLVVPGTGANYPIVQGENNYHYLNHLFDGRRNAAGAIFLDSYNRPDFSNRHTIIYGHNMLNGSMFGNLSRFRGQGFFDEHSVVLLVTPEQNYAIRLFAAYVTDVYTPAWRLGFTDDDVFAEWLVESRDRSEVYSDLEIRPYDQVITLSTCSSVFHNARLVVLGKLVPIS